MLSQVTQRVDLIKYAVVAIFSDSKTMKFESKSSNFAEHGYLDG